MKARDHKTSFLSRHVSAARSTLYLAALAALVCPAGGFHLPARIPSDRLSPAASCRPMRRSWPVCSLSPDEGRYGRLGLRHGPSKKTKTVTQLSDGSSETEGTEKQGGGMNFLSTELVLVVMALGGLALVLDESEHAVLHNFIQSTLHGEPRSLLDLVSITFDSVQGALSHNAFNSLLCFSFSDLAAQVLGQSHKLGGVMETMADSPEIQNMLGEASQQVMGEASQAGAEEALQKTAADAMARGAGGTGEGAASGGLAALGGSLNVERALKAGLLGVMINGVGYELWMYQLDRALPAADASWLSLATKTATDSLVWGTISNSLNLIGRRVLTGTPPLAAVQDWRRQIMAVTVDEFRFWPVWSAVNFHFVPHNARVSFAALGALVWNVYMSMAASDSEPKSEAVESEQTGRPENVEQ